MEHSIAAKYAARPAAHFVRPSARTRERRLGLRAAGSFQPSTARSTVLRRVDGSVLARHDHEFEEVRWISFDDAASLLTFETERALVGRARRALAAGAAVATSDAVGEGAARHAGAQPGA